MIDKYTEMKFSYTYNYAGFIRNKIFDNKPEDYLNETIDPDLDKLLKPDKETILHDYIQWVIEDEIEYLGRKVEPIEDWEELLNDYKVPFSKSDIDEDGSNSSTPTTTRSHSLVSSHTGSELGPG